MSSLVYICGRGAHEREAPNLPLYHIPRILSRVFAKKYCTNFFPKINESLCNLPIDFWVEMWYNNNVERGWALRSALARLPFDKGTEKIF